MSTTDQNASPNPRTPKRARTNNDDECSSGHSTLTKAPRKSKPSTINAAILYKCDDLDAAKSKLQEMVWCFSADNIPRVKTHFHKGSFVINPETNDLYILVHLRRSVPETKWTKIRDATGGVEVIMKPQDPWCDFYDFLLGSIPFTNKEKMVDNEDVFRHMADNVPFQALLQDFHGDSCQSMQSSSALGEDTDGSSRASFASSHQDHYGLLELSQIADVIEPAPRATDALAPADQELCRGFLSSDLPPSASTLDAIAALVKTFFSSLPNERGRYALGLLWLPQWETLADALYLEHTVLNAFNASCNMPPVPNVASLDVNLFPAGFSMQAAIGSLMSQRLPAFKLHMLLVDRTSVLYLLVVHMFHELFTTPSPHAAPPLEHFTKNLIQDVENLVHWRRSLAEFARSVQSMGMDSAGFIEPFLSHELQLPRVWRSFKPSPATASNHRASIVQQILKIKSKVKLVAARLDIDIDRGFASTVFWRMQDNTRLAAVLTVGSPFFHMLPPPSSSPSPASHVEDVQTLLDAFHFPLEALPVLGP